LIVLPRKEKVKNPRRVRKTRNPRRKESSLEKALRR
jgi:hypothetical protein